MKHIHSYKSFIAESAYAILGGDRPLTDKEFRKEVVEPTLGKDYVAYIMFDDKDYARQLEDIQNQYNVKKGDWERAGWKQIYRSSNYQAEAWTCPERQIIKAAVLHKGGIVGALYMKPEKALK
jgi:hypothetical protein